MANLNDFVTFFSKVQNEHDSYATTLVKVRRMLGITDNSVYTETVLKKMLDDYNRLKAGGAASAPVSPPANPLAPVAPAPAAPVVHQPGAGGTVVAGSFSGRSNLVDAFWKKTFEDDFPTLAPEGSFLSTYGKWDAYPNYYLTTAGQQDGNMKGDHYETKNLSVKAVDGLQVLNARLIPKSQTPDGKNWGAAPYPRFDVGHGEARSPSMKLEMRFRIPDQSDGWHPANLGWFDDANWPDGGEDDFYEQNTPGTIGAFFHNDGGRDGGDQRHFDTGVTPENWHVLGFEHIAGKSYKMFLDGKQIKPDDGGDDANGTILKRVPTGKMRLCLQNEPDGNPTQAMNIQYDWITVWTPA